MKGQWLGGYSGSTDGLIVVDVVDVDETVDGFAGYALLDFDKPPPQPFVAFETQTKAQDQRFSCAVAGVVGGQVERADVLSSRFPSYRLATRADVTLEWGSEQITLHWTTDIGTVGIATLPRSRATEPSTLPSQRMTWDAFKSHVSSLPFRAFAFRGQERKWRLRTSYHRTGRANLERFIQQDMQALHRHLRARTRHFFNLNVPDENGAFLNLIQHHGYPTPILDWTYSPFVAAYFAFSRIAATAPAQSDDTTAEVRVLLLDTARCVAQFPPVPLLTRMGPHFSLMEFSSVENERMIPQQAISTVSTVDDIETYILDIAGARDRGVLTCIDLPAGERGRAMRDLSMMGITAGSLFPGLDGACRELRERFFDLQLWSGE